jgi:hypothetical protein
LSRSIPLAVAGALIALLVLWFDRGAHPPPIQSDIDSLSVTSRETPTEPTLETPVGQKRAESPVRSPLSAVLRTEPNIFTVMDGRPFPEVKSSPWSREMENTILSYVSQHSFSVLTDLQVQCEDTGCVIFMGGPNIHLEQLNFGVFAEEQGFAFVVVRDRDGTDGKIVILRR